MVHSEKITSALLNSSTGVNKPAISRVSGKESSDKDPIPSGSKVKTSLERDEETSSDVGERARSFEANQVMRFASNSKSNFSFLNSPFPPYASTPSNTALNLPSFKASNEDTSASWNKVAAISTERNNPGLAGAGNFTYNSQATTADPLSFDSNLIPNYEANKAKLMASINVYDVGEVTMGGALPTNQPLGGQVKESVINHFLQNFGSNQKHIDLISEKGINVFIADNILGRAADNVSKVGAYYQTNGSLVFLNGFDKATFSHEAGHMMDHLVDGSMDGVIPISGYSDAMNKALATVHEKRLIYDPRFTSIGYGLNNDQEFLAVMFENYKNAPEAFKKEFPELNQVFDNFFGHLDATIRLNPSEEAN